MAHGPEVLGDWVLPQLPILPETQEQFRDTDQNMELG